MSKQEERVRQDWGGYQPETQKALRFVASLAGEGTAKQIAEAIAHEYAQREKSKPANKSTRQKTPSEAEWNAAIETIEDPFSRRIVRAIHEKAPGWML